MHPLQGNEVARFLDAIKGDDFGGSSLSVAKEAKIL